MEHGWRGETMSLRWLVENILYLETAAAYWNNANVTDGTT
jgi:hypothetical protein